jgi:hypothetical protein
MEAQRSSDLDSKANNITGIAGVLAALIAAIAGYLPQSRYPLLFIIPLVFLVISAIFGILAYWVKTYWAIKPTAIIDEYKDQPEDKVLREYTATVSKNIMDNHAVNDQKADRIQFGLVFLVVAITLFFIVAIINWL